MDKAHLERELQKLEDVYAMGFILDQEYNSRKAELQEQLGISSTGSSSGSNSNENSNDSNNTSSYASNDNNYSSGNNYASTDETPTNNYAYNDNSTTSYNSNYDNNSNNYSSNNNYSSSTYNDTYSNNTNNYKSNDDYSNSYNSNYNQPTEYNYEKNDYNQYNSNNIEENSSYNSNYNENTTQSQSYSQYDQDNSKSNQNQFTSSSNVAGKVEYTQGPRPIFTTMEQLLEYERTTRPKIEIDVQRIKRIGSSIPEKGEGDVTVTKSSTQYDDPRGIKIERGRWNAFIVGIHEKHCYDFMTASHEYTNRYMSIYRNNNLVEFSKRLNAYERQFFNPLQSYAANYKSTLKPEVFDYSQISRGTFVSDQKPFEHYDEKFPLIHLTLRTGYLMQKENLPKAFNLNLTNTSIPSYKEKMDEISKIDEKCIQLQNIANKKETSGKGSSGNNKLTSKTLNKNCALIRVHENGDANSKGFQKDVIRDVAYQNKKDFSYLPKKGGKDTELKTYGISSPSTVVENLRKQLSESLKK